MELICFYYTPALKKGGGGILVYICPWFCPSFRPSFRNSVTLFRQRYLHNRLRQKLHIWYTSSLRQVVSWDCKRAFSYLFFFVFVPFSFFQGFFVKDISTIITDSNFKFGIGVYNDMLYCGIENGPSSIFSSLYLFLFLSLQICRQRYLHNRLR